MSDAVERLREAVERERDGMVPASGLPAIEEGVDEDRAATDAAIDAVELTFRRQAAEVDRLNDACNRYAVRQADLEAEAERLRGVLRATHETYCTADWTERGLHAPECLLHELEANDE